MNNAINMTYHIPDMKYLRNIRKPLAGYTDRNLDHGIKFSIII